MCLSIVDGSPLYIELDSAVVGNVDVMRSARESFAFSIQSGYKVIVFDETQLVSKQAQASLLTVLEDAPKNVFFVFCTTNSEAILETIISRSLLLKYDSLTDQEIMDILNHITSIEKIEISELAKRQIIRRVQGHARDAVQQLERLKLIGDAAFTASNVFLEDQFRKILTYFSKNQRTEGHELIVEILKQPLEYVEQDFGLFIKRLSKGTYINKELAQIYREFLHYYMKNAQYIRSTNDWYLFLNSLAELFHKKDAQSTAPTSDRFAKK